MTYIEIEDDLLARLTPLRGELGVRTLESYGGQFSPDSFGQAAIRFPAVYLYLAGLESAGRNRCDDRILTCRVMVAARNLRGETAARRGAGPTPGVYALLEAVRARLNLVAVAGGRLRLTRERVTGYSAQLGLCVAEADFRLKFRTEG